MCIEIDSYRCIYILCLVIYIPLGVCLPVHIEFISEIILNTSKWILPLITPEYNLPDTTNTGGPQYIHKFMINIIEYSKENLYPGIRDKKIIKMCKYKECNIKLPANQSVLRKKKMRYLVQVTSKK